MESLVDLSGEPVTNIQKPRHILCDGCIQNLINYLRQDYKRNKQLLFLTVLKLFIY